MGRQEVGKRQLPRSWIEYVRGSSRPTPSGLKLLKRLLELAVYQASFGPGSFLLLSKHDIGKHDCTRRDPP